MRIMKELRQDHDFQNQSLYNVNVIIHQRLH